MANESLTILQPLPRAIFQRSPENAASVTVQGTSSPGIREVAIQVRPIRGGRAADERAATEEAPGTWRVTLTLPAGWYALDATGMTASGAPAATAGLEPVGVGEIFLSAGQSNACNYGSVRAAARDDRVCAFDGAQWSLCRDPQPLGDGDGGSPWPLLGDLIAARYDLPVGFCSVGVGGSSLAQWQPQANFLYARLRRALRHLRPYGLRAVLWHQGETDSLEATPAERYASMLCALIRQSRADAGYALPWGVALASFHPGVPDEDAAEVLRGQRLAVTRCPPAFEGPATDALQGVHRSPADGVHFSGAGLEAHAALWAERLAEALP